MTRRRDSRGFSLVELLVSLSLTLALTGVLFELVASSQRVSRAQPEIADAQQRLRVAADMLRRDLLMAGAGFEHGPAAGPLINLAPPIVPARTGARSPDPEMSFFSDRISIFFVPQGSTAMPLATTMSASTSDVPLDPATHGCPAAGLCGFTTGTRSLLVNPSAAGAGYEVFSVTAAVAGLAHGSPNPPFTRAYPARAVVVPVTQRVYYFDRPNRRLMVYDGYQSDVPLVDNVVDLSFSYLGDPTPYSAPQPRDDAGNCVYAAGAPPAPLLVDLGGTTLQILTSGQLTDGPACGVSPSRFDGDLLRVRQVRVMIRVQVTASELRGTGPRFAVGGTSRAGEAYAPDYQTTFTVTPRNMRPTRPPGP